jgi:hypothetical protein
MDGSIVIRRVGGGRRHTGKLPDSPSKSASLPLSRGRRIPCSIQMPIPQEPEFSNQHAV